MIEKKRKKNLYDKKKVVSLQPQFKRKELFDNAGKPM